MKIKHKMKKYNYIVLCMTLFLLGCQKRMTAIDYLNLGEKYLTEQKYEEAIVEFTKAIEMEPKLFKAYQGLSEIYTQQSKLDEAEKVEETWIEIYNNLSKEEKTEEMNLFFRGISQKIVRKEIEHKYMGKIMDIKNLLDIGIEAIWAGDPLGEDFWSQVRKLQNPILLKQKNEEYIVIDPDYLYIYFGAMKDEMKSGKGKVYKEKEKYVWIFDGNWENDYPNGYGKEMSYGSTNLEDLYIISSHEAEYLDGYENGEVVFREIHLKNGERDERIYIYNVKNGIGQIDRYSENGRPIYCISSSPNGLSSEYFVNSQTGESIKLGVSGFMREKDIHY